MGQYKTSLDRYIEGAKAIGDPYAEAIFRKTFSQGVFNEQTHSEFYRNLLEKAMEVNHPVLKDPYTMSWLCLSAREYDIFFIELEESFKSREKIRIGVGLLLPFYDPVRDDPRFVEIWEKYGFNKYFR